MCRYEMPWIDYKTHFACLDCQLSAKHPWDAGPRCRRCANPMTRMGHDFHAPRKTAKAQWEKVRRLAGAGILFHSCGCEGPGYRPRTLSDAKSRLHQRRTDRKVWAAR